MPTVAQLKAQIGADVSDLERGLDRADQRLKKTADTARKAAADTEGALSEAFRKVDTGAIRDIGGALTVGITLPMAAVGAASIKMASDTSESLSKVRVVFGQSAGQIEAWAGTAAGAFGMSRQAALEAAGTLGNLFTAMEIGQKPAADMSKSLVVLAADLGSFNNVKADDALIALRAGLVGETEPLRRFGVNLNEASIKAEAMRQGLIRSTDEGLTPAMKAQAAYALILAQTKTAQGDFARTSGGLANQMKGLESQLADAAATLGKEFLPVATGAVKTGTELVKWFTALPKPIKDTALAVGGIAAVGGPTLLVLGALVDGAKKVGEGWTALRDLAAVAKLAITGKAAALDVETLALKTNTEAHVLNAGAAKGSAGARVGGVLGQTVPGAIGVAAIGAVAIGAGMWMDHESRSMMDADVDATRSQAGLDSMRGRRRTRNGARASDLKSRLAMIRGLPQASTAGGKQRIAELEAELARLTGRPPRSLEGGPGAVGLTGGGPELDADAGYGIELGRARAGLVGATDQREAAALIPILQRQQADREKRAGALRGRAGKDVKAAKDLADLEREYWGVERDIQELRLAAAKERDEQQKEAADKAHRIDLALHGLHESQWAARQQQAQAGLALAPEGSRSQAEAAVMTPLLRERQAEMEAMGRLLLPHVNNSMDHAARFLALQREYFAAQEQINRLQMGAAQEQRENGQRLVEAREKAQEAEVRAQREALQRSREAYRKHVSELQGLAEAQVGLATAQLRNNPFLSDGQRRQALTPALVQQYRTMLRPVQGESEVDRVKRLTEGEGVRGQILQNIGLTGRNPYLYTRQGQRQARGILGWLDREAQGAMGRPITAPTSVVGEGGGGGVTINIGSIEAGGDVLHDPRARARLHAEIDARLDDTARRAAPGVRR